MKQDGAYRILINGIVQGVGFRPFIYNLALRYQLTGWVRNTSGGVEIQVCGPESRLDSFLSSISTEAPPLSLIESIHHEPITADGYDSFQIQQSEVIEGAFQPISPDVSICADCLKELFDPNDFRYRYAFINCTNCGPRFTIIQDIPYDRPLTTMADFALCPTCEEEYQDPVNRRFHAQPVACPACGPEIWLESSQEGEQELSRGDQAVLEAQEMLAQGKILAVKGLGGFHLACDAENSDAVQLLRERKYRPAKPMAVMMPDLDTVRKYCQISAEDEDLLSSPRRPILLLDRKPGIYLPEEIAPHQNKIGVMLPYTPLHFLLFSNEDQFPSSPYSVLVMTSANFRGNPILTDNHMVRDQLGAIADYFLLHNRDIYIQCDDSVLGGYFSPEMRSRNFYFIRRSRGFAPQPLTSPLGGESVLALGAELKNTFCHTKNTYAFLSQHIGDLKNFHTLTTYQDSINHYEKLFRIHPQLLVHDAHPDYLSSLYASERSDSEGLPTISVQHHHAHIASCLADNLDPGLDPVIGLAFDGVGFGDDGNIWGGEFLIADYGSYERFGHLAYFPLPGGDLAIREPWRCALSLLRSLEIPWADDIPAVAYAQSLKGPLPGIRPVDALGVQLETSTNSPLTSSLGRLFDAVASILGIRHIISYEGQAAIELEALADPDETSSYPLDISPDNIISPHPLILGLLQDLRNGVSVPKISARFHNSLAQMALETISRIRIGRGLFRVALSGGVWQNINLLIKTQLLLTDAGFEVLVHHKIPPNDGGIALGQAVIGQNYLSPQE